MAYERIIRRIGFIEHQLTLIKDWRPPSLEIFLNDEKLQAAIEHKIQIIIEAIIQICVQLINILKLGPPSSEEDIFLLLQPKLRHFHLIMELKKFRNFLVHQYIELDVKRIYQYINSFLSDVEIILEEIRQLLANFD